MITMNNAYHYNKFTILYSFFELFHYSDNPNLMLSDLKSIDLEKQNHFKPHGFWVSIEDAWEIWCKSEEFRLNKLKYKYRILLKKECNIFCFVNNIIPYCHAFSENSIDWKMIAKEFDGSVMYNFHGISDNLPKQLLWDCNSMCIWNVNCIESIEKIN